jgi:argininosuccinate lyase
MKVDAAKCRSAFSPEVFATDVALRMVAAGTPWRDAYHEVRDHLERLVDEDCDAAVAAKSHEGTTGGIDHALYRARFAAAKKSVNARLKALDAKCKALLK